MARYLLTICYDGSDFCGFQTQPNLPSVQGELERALSRRFDQKTEIVASGRTDTGVHAFGQMAHFDTDKAVDVEKIVVELNALLPPTIAVESCCEVECDFHARFDATSKTYIYKVYLSKRQCPFKERYFHICGYDLDVEKMQEACKLFVGKHDFKSFCMAEPDKDNAVRTIFDMHIDVLDGQKELDFVVQGDGFLRRMVRIVVGTIIDVGRGRFSLDEIEKMFDKKDRRVSGKTLQPSGLYLKEVRYGQKKQKS